jgi:hypothetical protein
MSFVLSVSAFAAYDFEITEGRFGALTVEDHETLLMTGGGGDSLTAIGFSALDIRNTTSFSKTPAGGIWTMDLWGYSQLDFSGGDIYDFSIYGSARTIFSGGQIHQIWSYQTAHILFPESRHIEIICKPGYLYNSSTLELSGLWMDNTPFDIQLKNIDGYSQAINNIKFTTPEPATLLLLGLGGLISRKRKS